MLCGKSTGWLSSSCDEAWLQSGTYFETLGIRKNHIIWSVESSEEMFTEGGYVKGSAMPNSCPKYTSPARPSPATTFTSLPRRPVHIPPPPLPHRAQKRPVVNCKHRLDLN